MEVFNKYIIKNLSDKLLIGLTEKDYEIILNEFDNIKKNMDLINNIPDIDKVEPLSFPFELENIELREDVANESINIDDLLSNCDNHTDREIEVPKVVG